MEKKEKTKATVYKTDGTPLEVTFNPYAISIEDEERLEEIVSIEKFTKKPIDEIEKLKKTGNIMKYIDAFGFNKAAQRAKAEATKILWGLKDAEVSAASIHELEQLQDVTQFIPSLRPQAKKKSV
jgi:hypothetical protein